MSGHAELMRDRVGARREDLVDHNPEAVAGAGVGLAAMHEAAYGRVPSIRCDRQARYRGMQLQGEKVLPYEDLWAIALECAAGAAVVLAGIEPLARRLGFVLAPAERGDEALQERNAQLIERASLLAAGLQRGLQDQVLSVDEATALGPVVRQLKETLGAIELALQQRSGDR
jgi:hypothetical protein